jgi:hypothetical protein
MSQLGFLSKLLLTFSITKRCRFHCLNCTGVSSNASNINNASPYTAVECQATSNSMLSNGQIMRQLPTRKLVYSLKEKNLRLQVPSFAHGNNISPTTNYL